MLVGWISTSVAAVVAASTDAAAITVYQQHPISPSNCDAYLRHTPSPFSPKNPPHLSHRQPVAADDAGWVDLGAHQIICALQQLCCQDHHAGGAISNLLVLQVRQLDQNLREKKGIQSVKRLLLSGKAKLPCSTA